VTEADLAVQEMILAEMAKTKLTECRLIAEEDTPAVSEFIGVNGLVLTIDPIDGTFIYVGKGRLFSVIVCLNDGKVSLYTYLYYPAVDWSRRITRGEITDFGKLPKVKVRNGLDLTRIIAYTFGEPEKTMPAEYSRLIQENYVFRKLSDITSDSGSGTLFSLGQVAGYYTESPGAYDGIGVLHYAQVKKLMIKSTLDLSQPLLGPHGQYYPGWYYVLRKVV
jgi:fructose-1,6-bisphosphatase/inositol monophosphatase family enzyme